MVSYEDTLADSYAILTVATITEFRYVKAVIIEPLRASVKSFLD